MPFDGVPDRQEIVVSIIDNTMDRMAVKIHAVQQAAYLQEAELLGAVVFPPLSQTIADIQRMSDFFFGASFGEELVGVLSIDQSASPIRSSISSVTVTPAYQRRGVARMLLSIVLDADQSAEVIVSTGCRNMPALALYAAFCFEPCAYRTVGPEPLELVDLKRIRPNEASNE